jgi:tetratricopeptide (TPR) repeat protein
MLWRGLRFLSPARYARKVEREAARCLERAGEFAKQGAYGQAIAHFTRAIKLNPLSAEAFINRGIARAMSADVEGSIGDFDEAIRLNPRDDTAYCCRGSALGAMDKPRAIADFSRAIEINPGNAEAYYNRGVAHYGLAEFDAAIADCTKAIELNPRRANAYYTLGNAFAEKEDWDQAISSHDQAVALNANDTSFEYFLSLTSKTLQMLFAGQDTDIQSKWFA